MATHWDRLVDSGAPHGLRDLGRQLGGLVCPMKVSGIGIEVKVEHLEIDDDSVENFLDRIRVALSSLEPDIEVAIELLGMQMKFGAI